MPMRQGRAGADRCARTVERTCISQGAPCGRRLDQPFSAAGSTGTPRKPTVWCTSTVDRLGLRDLRQRRSSTASTAPMTKSTSEASSRMHANNRCERSRAVLTGGHAVPHDRKSAG